MSENQPQARRQFWIFTHTSVLAAPLREAQWRSLFRVPRRPQGDGYRCGNTVDPQLPRKWHVTAIFRAYSCSVRCLSATGAAC
jgi:hypothetical protein